MLIMQKDPLPSTFPCLFCNHENSVTVKMDKKAGIGELVCKVCGQQFQTGINFVYTDLSAGVDVYSDWIDACDSVAKEAAYTTGDGEDSGQYYERAGLGDSEAHFEMAGVTRTSTGGRDDDDDVEGYGGDEFR
ncbi:MAG: hypothetical protein L6R41_003486 [Letrouitia leprolyta]|nr:MAG: hypothetical protein L6R41_003486 [Letrouitia leprolyta]